MKNLLKLASTLIFKNRPLYVHYGLTHRCNLQCRMCNVYRDASEDEELSIEQIEKVFDILRSLGIVYVSIGGGEPFLRQDLPAIISLLIKKGFMVRLLTNGTLVDEGLIKDIVSSGLKEISVSLDTLDHQKQAYICNRSDTGEKIIRSIDIFSRALSKNRRFLLINTVVSRLNIDELPQLSQFAKSKGYYISFVPVETHGYSEFAFTQDEHQSIDENYDYLMQKKKEGRSSIFNSSIFLEKSRQYLKFGNSHWSCDAGRLYFSLSPKGELSICHKFNQGVSLLKAGTEGILASKEFEHRRQSLIKGCSGCMRPCWAEISLLFRNKASLFEMSKVRFFS